MDCSNELMVCIERPNKTASNRIEKTNAVYEKIFKNIKEKIKNNKEISKEDIDFIESLSDNKKMEIIKEYNKKTVEIEKLLALQRATALR